MYTDGLIDAMDFDGQLWGVDRMLTAATECTECSADQMLRRIIAHRRRFVGLARQIDDTTIVAVKLDADQFCDDCDCGDEDM